jgi:hypothetical protein
VNSEKNHSAFNCSWTKIKIKLKDIKQLFLCARERLFLVSTLYQKNNKIKKKIVRKTPTADLRWIEIAHQFQNLLLGEYNNYLQDFLNGFKRILIITSITRKHSWECSKNLILSLFLSLAP